MGKMKKVLSLILALCLMISCVPFSVSAEGEQPADPVPAAETEETGWETPSEDDAGGQDPEAEETAEPAADGETAEEAADDSADNAAEPEAEVPVEAVFPTEAEAPAEAENGSDSGSAPAAGNKAESKPAAQKAAADPELFFASGTEEVFYPMSAVPTPLAFTGTQLDMTHAYLSWAIVAVATGYQIQRASSSNFSEGLTVWEVGSSVNNLTRETAVGKTYYFRIRSIDDTDPLNIVYSEWSSTAIVRTTPDKPSDLAINAVTSAKAKLSWSAVTGVKGYIVERDGQVISKQEGAANVTFDDSGLTLGTTYNYAVYAYVTGSNGEEVRSQEGKEAEYICVPPAPANVKATAAGVSTIRVSWDKVPGVAYYEVYRAPESGSNFTKVGAAAGENTLYYDDLNRVTGQVYQYYVIAVYSEAIKSEKSATVTGAARPAAPANVTARYADDTSICITWEGVEDANGYIIEYSTTRDGTYTELTHGALETLTYTHTGLTIGTRYYYRVLAYLGSYADTTRYSETSPVVSDSTRPGAPEHAKLANVAFNKLKLTFDAVSGADGYEISYGTDGENFQPAAIQAGTSFTSGALTVGQTYFYRVRAYALDTDGITKLFGDYCEPVSLRVVPLASSSLTATRVNPRTNQVKLTWNAVYGVNGYYIYAEQDDGTETLVATTDVVTTYTVGSLHQGSKYVFSIRGFRNEGSQKVTGLQKKAAAITLTIPVVKDFTSEGNADNNSILVKWGQIYGIDGYEVIVTGIDDSYSLETDAAEAQLNITDLIPGNRYKVEVRGFGVINDTRVYGPYGTVTNLSPKPLKPETFGVSTLTASYGIYLKWSVVEGCTGYRIQRSLTANSGYTDLLHIEGSGSLSYYDIHTAADAGIKYYYRVAAYIENTGLKTYSDNTPVRSATVLAPKPKNLTAEAASTTKVHLSWDAVASASGYQVSMATSLNGTYDPIAKVTGTTYDVDGLQIGKEYYFKVRAYNTVGSQTVLGTASDAVKGTPAVAAPATLSGVAYPTSVKLTWSAVSGANGYSVYYKLSTATSYAQAAATVTGTTYTVTGLDCGKNYDFYVVPYKTVGGSRCPGSASAVLTKRTGITAPTGISITAVNSTKVQIKWKAMSGVSGYEISKSTEPAGTYAVIGNPGAAATQLDHTVQRPGWAYYFKIRAYVNQSDGSRYYGPYSAVTTGRALPTAPKNLKAITVWRKTIILNWTQTDTVVGYKVFYRVSGTYTWSIDTLVGDNITEYIISNLTPNTEYQILLRPLTRDENDVVINGLGTTTSIYVKTKP